MDFPARGHLAKTLAPVVELTELKRVSAEGQGDIPQTPLGHKEDTEVAGVS